MYDRIAQSSLGMCTEVKNFEILQVDVKTSNRIVMKCKDFEAKSWTIFNRIDRFLIKHDVNAHVIASQTLDQEGAPTGRQESTLFNNRVSRSHPAHSLAGCPNEAIFKIISLAFK